MNPEQLRKIYPLTLTRPDAEDLLRGHLGSQAVDEALARQRGLYGSVHFEFCGTLREDRTVSAFVWYRFDRGWMQGSGRILDSAFTASAEDVAPIISAYKDRVAEAVLLRRKEEQHRREVAAIREEIFGCE